MSKVLFEAEGVSRGDGEAPENAVAVASVPARVICSNWGRPGASCRVWRARGLQSPPLGNLHLWTSTSGRSWVQSSELKAAPEAKQRSVTCPGGEQW